MTNLGTRNSLGLWRDLEGSRPKTFRSHSAHVSSPQKAEIHSCKCGGLAAGTPGRSRTHLQIGPLFLGQGLWEWAVTSETAVLGTISSLAFPDWEKVPLLPQARGYKSIRYPRIIAIHQIQIPLRLL